MEISVSVQDSPFRFYPFVFLFIFLPDEPAF